MNKHELKGLHPDGVMVKCHHLLSASSLVQYPTHLQHHVNHELDVWGTNRYSSLMKLHLKSWLPTPEHLSKMRLFIAGSTLQNSYLQS